MMMTDIYDHISCLHISYHMAFACHWFYWVLFQLVLPGYYSPLFAILFTIVCHSVNASSFSALRLAGWLGFYTPQLPSTGLLSQARL